MLNTSKGSRVAHPVNKQKKISELLVEELKQGEEEATQAQQEADVKLLEAQKLASQYQKEADKCSSGNTCEEAREKSCRVHKLRVPNGPASQHKLGPADDVANDVQLLG